MTDVGSDESELFPKDRTVITRHINNVFKEDELEKKRYVHNLHIPLDAMPWKGLCNSGLQAKSTIFAYNNK